MESCCFLDAQGEGGGSQSPLSPSWGQPSRMEWAGPLAHPVSILAEAGVGALFDAHLFKEGL